MEHWRLTATLTLGLSTLVGFTQAQESPLLERARAAIGVGRGTPVPATIRFIGTYWTSQAVTTDFKAGVRRSENRETALEMLVGMPDRLARLQSDAIFVSTVGFVGSRGFQRTEGLRPDSHGGIGVLTGEALTFRQLELWQIMVGVLASPTSVRGIRLSEVGQNTLRITGPENFNARLELDPATGRPTRIVRRTRFRVVPPETIFGPASEGGAGAGRVPDSEPEDDLTMTFSDRKLVDGLSLPFRITTSGKGVTMLELRFKQIVLNPTFTAKDFE